jgi:serine-type D-Ala-D-Ala carboxypeptidase/endopeptidase (penicillin-binding protein 4)
MPALGGRFPRLVALGPPLVALALLVAGAPPATAGTTPGTATLGASRSEIVFGDAVRLTGQAGSDDPACVGGRPVNLQGREPGQSAWTLLGAHTTATDGTYAFSRRPEHTTSYRVVLPDHVTADASCARVVSPQAATTVDVRVELSLATNPLFAGNCSGLRVTVSPPKPGTPVQLEQLQGDGWQALFSGNLTDASRASGSVCYGWRSIGSVRLRATWPAPDALNGAGSSRPVALRVVKAPWMVHIDQLTSGRSVSVSVAAGPAALYERADGVRHAPASNEKLLQSMALLDRLGPAYRIETRAAATHVSGGRVLGALWLLGRGDPAVGKRAIAALATRIVSAGVRRVGRVMGAVNYFSHDWWATGWKSFFPSEEVALPSALTYRRNQVRGHHVGDPERRAAVALTRALERRGVHVRRKAAAGAPPSGLRPVASIESDPLQQLLRIQNLHSDNFSAEVLGKLLGVARYGRPGTIAKGAAALRSFAAAHGVRATSYDSSGLSYANRLTAFGIVKLLRVAEASSWGGALRATLPAPGQGTLEDRLHGVPVRAKTGTLHDISALSGWVRLSRTGRWARFSILSSGFSASREKDIEDGIVRTLWKYGH